MRAFGLLVLLVLVAFALPGVECRKCARKPKTKPPPAPATAPPKRCCPAPTENVLQKIVSPHPTIIEPLWQNNDCSDYYYIYCAWSKVTDNMEYPLLFVGGNNGTTLVWTKPVSNQKNDPFVQYPFVLKMKVECDRETLTWNAHCTHNITTLTCADIDQNGQLMIGRKWNVPTVLDSVYNSPLVNTNPPNLLTVPTQAECASPVALTISPP